MLIVGGTCSIALAAIALLITLFSTVRQLRLAASLQLRVATTLSEVLLRGGAVVSPDVQYDCLRANVFRESIFSVGPCGQSQ